MNYSVVAGAFAHLSWEVIFRAFIESAGFVVSDRENLEPYGQQCYANIAGKYHLSGYEILQLFHSKAQGRIAETCRQSFDLVMIPDVKSDIDIVESRLRSDEANLLNVSISPGTLPHQPIAHSWTVGWDAGGFFVYDTNHGQVLPHRFKDLVDVPGMNDGLIYVKK